MSQPLVRRYCALCGLAVLLGCSPSVTPAGGVSGARAPAPQAEPPAIQVALEAPLPAPSPSTSQSLEAAPVDAVPAVEVGAGCRGSNLQLSELRSRGLCRVPREAEKLSYDVTKRAQLVRQTLSVRAGARLDFIARLLNLTDEPLVVDVRVGSGFSSVAAYKLSQSGVDVNVGKCSMGSLTSSEWYRVEIPAGASLGLDGDFYANDARADPTEAPCPPAPLGVGTYELEVSVAVNGQQLQEQFELQVR